MATISAPESVFYIGRYKYVCGCFCAKKAPGNLYLLIIFVAFTQVFLQQDFSAPVPQSGTGFQRDAPWTMEMLNKEMKADKEVEVLTSVKISSINASVHQPSWTLSLSLSSSVSLSYTHIRKVLISHVTPLWNSSIQSQKSFESQNSNNNKKMMQERWDECCRTGCRVVAVGFSWENPSEQEPYCCNLKKVAMTT